MLGRLVGDALRISGGTSVTLVSRSGAGDPSAQGRRADVLTGEGLDAALAGQDVAIWTAHDREAVTNGAKAVSHLIAAAQRTGVRHIVYTGIAGIETALTSPYYAGKALEEAALERGVVPFTILRAAQFHELAVTLVEACDDGAAIRAPRFMLRPVAAKSVAERLALLALGEPAGRARDVVGPEDLSVGVIARQYIAAKQLSRELIEVEEAPERWRTLAALTHGPAERIGPTFAEWLQQA